MKLLLAFSGYIFVLKKIVFGLLKKRKTLILITLIIALLKYALNILHTVHNYNFNSGGQCSGGNWKLSSHNDRTLRTDHILITAISSERTIIVQISVYTCKHIVQSLIWNQIRIFFFFFLIYLLIYQKVIQTDALKNNQWIIYKLSPCMKVATFFSNQKS